MPVGECRLACSRPRRRTKRPLETFPSQRKGGGGEPVCAGKARKMGQGFSLFWYTPNGPDQTDGINAQLELLDKLVHGFFILQPLFFLAQSSGSTFDRLESILPWFWLYSVTICWKQGGPTGRPTAKWSCSCEEWGPPPPLLCRRSLNAPLAAHDFLGQRHRILASSTHHCTIPRQQIPRDHLKFVPGRFPILLYNFSTVANELRIGGRNPIRGRERDNLGSAGSRN